MPDYFELFAITPALRIDAKALQARYRQLQARYHPDNFSETVDALAVLQKSSEVNEAYQTLKDPLKCAQYLCRLHGVTPPERDIPLAILQAQMALREELDEASATQLPALIARLDADWQGLLAAGEVAVKKADWSALAQVVMQWLFVDKVRQTAQSNARA